MSVEILQTCCVKPTQLRAAQASGVSFQPRAILLIEKEAWGWGCEETGCSGHSGRGPQAGPGLSGSLDFLGMGLPGFSLGQPPGFILIMLFTEPACTWEALQATGMFYCPGTLTIKRKKGEGGEEAGSNLSKNKTNTSPRVKKWYNYTIF